MKFAKVMGALCIASAVMLFCLLALALARSRLPFQTMFSYVALLGAAVGGLLYIGIDAMLTFGRRGEGEATGGLVLRRDPSGRVVSIKGSSGGAVVRRSGFGARPPRVGGESMLRLLKFGIAAGLLFEAYLLAALYFGTFTPLMVVSSPSMAPTLNVGDLIVVRGVDPSTVNVGDIIVFNVPEPYSSYTPSPVVHKVSAILTEGASLAFKTEHENPPGEDPWAVPAENLVGVCVWKVPYLGLPIVFIRTPIGLTVTAALALIWILYPYIRRRAK